MTVINKIARTLLTEAARASKKYYTSAIIVAAGKSTRTSGSVPKQLVPLCGIPVVVRSILAFEKCDGINEIVIVAAEGETGEYEIFREEYGLGKLAKIVCGGDTREKSVLRGFEAVSEKADFIAIHDGARCLIKTDDVTRILKKAYGCGAAIASAKSTDTLKLINNKGVIKETVDRSVIIRAQTPQVFMKDVYAASVYTKRDSGLNVTDDSVLVEAKGFKVKTVDVGAYNIKITTDEDFYVAERIIMNGERS